MFGVCCRWIEKWWSALPLYQQVGAVILAVVLVMVIRELLMQAFEKDLKGERVLITGAGSGIGRLMALRFARMGAHLVLWDINETGLLATAAEATKENAPSVSVKVVDITNKEAVRSAAAETGEIDILINNAGIVTGKKIFEASDAMIEKTFQVNVISHFWTIRAFLPSMLERNHGHIVTVASASGLVGVPGLTDYAASKFAAVGLDESLRLELRRLGKDGVHTTCVCPFYINTGMFEGVSTRFSFLLPILEPPYVADSIITAIRRNSPQLSMPFMISTVPIFRALPVWFFDWCGDFLGITHSMDHFVGRSGAPTAAPVESADEADTRGRSGGARRRRKSTAGN